MTRHSTLLIAVFLGYASHLVGQVTLTAREFVVQVYPAQPWTDAGLDLQSGDALELSATGSSDQQPASGATVCDPKGVTATAAQTADLPLPSAPVGALIARLHAHGSAPVLVGASREVHIAEPSHLMLGMNMSGTPPCQGGISVKVHVIPAGSSAANTTEGQQTPRSQQLKSQLATAAQVFMSGQFGMGNSDTGASNASGNASGADASVAVAPLKVSDAALDSDLVKSLNSLPRRVNDQFQNQGDMVNFVLVGSEQQVKDALDAASWRIADTDNKEAVLKAVLETYQKKDYLQMPMSQLYLFGRKQDFGYELAQAYSVVASRHHFRIWKAPATWNGQTLWAGAGTHDIGFEKDQRNGKVTHKIDPAVDGERDNIGQTLQTSGKVKSLYYYLPKDPVEGAKNATGGGYHSDGRVLVVVLQ
jgi:LssY C-terminus